ncbi:Lsr2 dimerization domain-containing protein [Nocardia arthritidis]|uniref:Lsr2 family protein n=1 Tax=Nocardia arthritidis TaxID=228602 RepID=A0A6G9YTT5_9NOCA|nr:histone-like nucleoid-structuring protein Lsr2 [Nocardia arthritidis]QIS16511.1 hypothetical protein F5544_43535 [Nocardia arthritidis]
MAKEVVYKDDVTGEEINKELVGGNPTIIIEIDGERYALDAGVKTRDALRKSLQKYIDVARTPTADEDPVTALISSTGGGRRNPARGAAKSSSSSTGSGRSSEELQHIRDWARKQAQFKDRNISDRGRVAQDIQDAFDAAHK